MPRETLPPDPAAVEAWKAMSQSAPTNQALPPAMGGMIGWRWLLVLFGILAGISLLAYFFGRG